MTVARSALREEAQQLANDESDREEIWRIRELMTELAPIVAATEKEGRFH